MTAEEIEKYHQILNEDKAPTWLRFLIGFTIVNVLILLNGLLIILILYGLRDLGLI